MAKMLLKGQDRIKGDERILGDGEFVESVLERCNENYSRHQHLVVQGVDLKTLSHAVAHYFDLDYDQLIPRSLSCRGTGPQCAVLSGRKGTGYYGHPDGPYLSLVNSLSGGCGGYKRISKCFLPFVKK